MPTSTFWNQVRLLTPNLEPLITLSAEQYPVALCWPWHWTGDWAPAGAAAQATLLLETPPLTLVRTALPWKLQVWTSPLLPGAAILHPIFTDQESSELPDDRLWAAVIEVLGGMGPRHLVLLEDGIALTDSVAPADFVTLRDHINWTRDNYLVGYPVESDTPSRFIDTQTLYRPIAGIPDAIACLTAIPALQTPAERTLAQQLGGEVLANQVGLLALLAHFKRLPVSVLLRLHPAASPVDFPGLLSPLSASAPLTKQEPRV